MQNSSKLTYYVLHRRPYRESSQIIELFCEKQGRFSALYRVNKKQPALQPFIPYQMQFSGRGDLKYCQHVEIHYPSIYASSSSSKDGAPVKGQLLKGRNLYCGFYLNELIMRLAWKGEPQPELYRVYQQTLLGLLQLENDLQSEPLLRRFEFHLLAILGYQYNWQQDSECRDIQAELFYSFDPSSGFNLITDHSSNNFQATTNNSYAASRLKIFPGHAILAIAAEDWQHELSWPVAKHIARLALNPLLGYKPLASRELFQKM